MRIVSRPVVDLEPRRGLEQEGLAGAVEVFREHEGRGHEGAEHVVVRVLDADKRRAVGRSAAVSGDIQLCQITIVISNESAPHL